MSWFALAPEDLETPPPKEILQQLLQPIDQSSLKETLRAIHPGRSEESIEETLRHWPYSSIASRNAPSGRQGQ